MEKRPILDHSFRSFNHSTLCCFCGETEHHSWKYALERSSLPHRRQKAKQEGKEKTKDNRDPKDTPPPSTRSYLLNFNYSTIDHQLGINQWANLLVRSQPSRTSLFLKAPLMSIAELRTEPLAFGKLSRSRHNVCLGTSVTPV